ncbi:protein Star [Diabrotica virgifera virgifera]|uniref:Protein Star n=1 Tax=Diabrotica virgifera virgifera TaxID=50390 RepID=A0ABM5JTF9_DIAVI|nr:protein Star [Diabrotica virgifera virgifera]XP_050501223.1 protein Star [Diabrotica virgifera virgifera]
MTISNQCQNPSADNNLSDILTAAKVNNMESETSVTRKLLPLAAFFMAFTTVMTVLIVYMDNTAIKHYQFRVNMSQDYDLLGVSQDDPQLIMYIRAVHLTPAIEPNHKPLKSEDEISEDTAYVIKLLNNKHKGFFIEAGAYGDGKSKTEWLEENLGWQGLLIQPDPRHYFSLRRHNRKHSQAIHGCISPSPHPKEVSLHPENGGIKVNSIRSSLLDMDDSDWFNTRVKCFPLYSLLLATNVTNIDYLILETGGTELQVLETVPFERTNIEVINVQVRNNDTEKDTLKKFLALKKYKFMENFNESYVFMLTH